MHHSRECQPRVRPNRDHNKMRPFRKYKGDAAAVAYSSMSVRDYNIIIISRRTCRYTREYNMIWYNNVYMHMHIRVYGQSDVITTRVFRSCTHTLQRYPTPNWHNEVSIGCSYIYAYYYILLYCIHTSSSYIIYICAYTHRGVGCNRSCTYIYRFVSIEYNIICTCARRLSYTHLYIMCI